MKVALVHDYIKEYGGAERVLKTLTQLYPKAPIYTAFCVNNSSAGREFKNKKIIQSWFSPILKLGKLYSPLRFLIPSIWGGFDLSGYDLVITSSSWYVTRGFKIGPKTKVIDYCHTPPRWLYGYQTSVGFNRYWPVKIYSVIVGHFIRMFDFTSAQVPNRKKNNIRAGVDVFVANSKNVADRIEKFYRRDSVVVYPPVDVSAIIKATNDLKKENYYLIVSRLVGAKGIEEAAKAAKKAGFNLKIVGEAHGYSDVERKLKNLTGKNIQLLGRVDDDTLYKLYAKAKGFIALARDEDFGITVVEAQAAGTPVIAFRGGGFLESVVEGKTGIFIDNTNEKSIAKAVSKFEKMKWDKSTLRQNAQKFSKELFKKEFLKLTTV